MTEQFYIGEPPEPEEYHDALETAQDVSDFWLQESGPRTDYIPPSVPVFSFEDGEGPETIYGEAAHSDREVRGHAHGDHHLTGGRQDLLASDVSQLDEVPDSVQEHSDVKYTDHDAQHYRPGVQGQQDFDAGRSDISDTADKFHEAESEERDHRRN